MKHKQTNQNSSDAWKKIGIAAVLIVAVFGFLLFLEGKMTGMAASGSTGASIATTVVLTEANPNKIVYAGTTALSTGEKQGQIALFLLGNYQFGSFKVSKNLKEFNLTFSKPGVFPLGTSSLKKGTAYSYLLNLSVQKNESGKTVNKTLPATLLITYNGIKYFKNVKTNGSNAKASLYFDLILEQPLDISDGLAKKELEMPDNEEKIIYNGAVYKGLSIGGKTYSFKMLMDPSGEVAVYFNKLGDYVELTKSTTFLVENNGKVKVTVWGWSDSMKLVADVQWIKPVTATPAVN